MAEERPHAHGPDKNWHAGSSARRGPGAATVAAVVLILFSGGYLLWSAWRAMGAGWLGGLQTFGMVFVSILMQAIPFLIIGSLVSSALHVFVRDAWLIRVFPRKHGLGFLTAMVAGLFFPVCECAIVPVVLRLVKKGVALPIAVTFMLSAPIINPIVIVSTLYAFPGRPEIALMRVAFGLGIALVVGLIFSAVGWTRSVHLPGQPEEDACHCACCGHEGHDSHGGQTGHSRWKELFLHTREELFRVGKYLIIGAGMTALILSAVPRSSLGSLGEHGLSLLVLMAAAFLFSACSTSDAFLAKSLMSRFPLGAVMGFLVFGPMMDVKNLLMLLSGFPRRFVAALSLLIAAVNFAVLYVFFFML